MYCVMQREYTDRGGLAILSFMNWGHFLHSVSIFRFREILLLKVMEILCIRQSGILLHGCNFTDL